MKKLFKKLALAVVALLTFSVGSNYTVKEVKAADGTVLTDVFKFDNPNDSATYTTYEYQISNYFTINWSKGSSSSNINGKYYSPIRVYQGHILKFSFDSNYVAGINSFIIEYDTEKDAPESTWSPSADVSVSGTTVKVSFDSLITNEITFTAAKQTRWNSIQIEYTPAGQESDEDRVGALISSFANLSKKEIYMESEEIELPTSSEVTYSYELETDSSMFELLNNKLIITPSEGRGKANLILNASYGNYSDTYALEFNAGLTPLTVLEANTIASLYTSENGKYYVKGIISSIENETYGNMYLTDIDGNQIYVYGVYDSEGNQYSEIADKPEVEDEITLFGALYFSYGKNEIVNGTIINFEKADYSTLLSLEETKASLAFDYSFTYTEKQVSGVLESKTASYNFATEFDVSSTSFILDENITLTRSATNNYYNPIRVYKNNIITISGANIKTISSITIVANTASYASLTKNWNIGDVSVDNKIVSVNITEENVTNVVFTASDGQVRWDSISIEYKIESEGETTTSVLESENYSNIKVRYGAIIPSEKYEGVSPKNIGVLVVPTNQLTNAGYNSIKSLLNDVKVSSIADFVSNSKSLENSVNFANIACVPNKVNSTYEVAADLNILDEINNDNLSRLWTELTAVVYVETSSSIVLLNESNYSVESMVDTYIANVKADSSYITNDDLILALNNFDSYIAAQKAVIETA